MKGEQKGLKDRMLWASSRRGGRKEEAEKWRRERQAENQGRTSENPRRIRLLSSMAECAETRRKIKDEE